MSADPWLEYRLERLTFQNGETLSFPSGTSMLYEPEDHAIWVEMPRAAGKRIVADLQRHNDPTGKFQELKRIDYFMLVEGDDIPGGAARLGFFHMLKPGSGVGLSLSRDGDLFFHEDRGRALFSKDYTLRDVSQGKIKSNFKVWQFHGYRHEH